MASENTRPHTYVSIPKATVIAWRISLTNCCARFTAAVKVSSVVMSPLTNAVCGQLHHPGCERPLAVSAYFYVETPKLGKACRNPTYVVLPVRPYYGP